MNKISKYRPEIDGLRAVAVLSVILFHTGLGVMPGGYVGVDIFFVISGFLITNIIFQELNEDRFSLTTFYERRIRRIFPAFFVVVFASTLAAWFILTPGELKDYSQSVLASSIFLSNIYFFLKTDYFATNSEELPLLHTWSLSLEEQFYAFFPLLMIALFFINRKLITEVIITLLLISLTYSLFIGVKDATFNFYMLPTRGWELLAGSLLAIKYPYLRGLVMSKTTLSSLLELLGALAIIGSIMLLDSESVFPGLTTIPVVFGTFLLILTMHKKSIIGKVLSSRHAVGLGLVSYSAYLIHQPLFVYVRLIDISDNSILIILLVPISLILAYLSWKYVEQPFRNKNWITSKAIFSFGLTAIVFSVLFGLAGHFNDGFSQRFDSKLVAVSKSALASPHRSSCHTDGINYLKPQSSCFYGKNAIKWAVFGDSHGVELAAALGDFLNTSDMGVRHLSFSGCPPALLFTIDNPGCNEWVGESLDYLKLDSDIKSVIIVYRYGLYLYGDHLNEYPNIPDDAPSFMIEANPEFARSKFWESLALIVKQLQESGKNVYLLEPIPELPTHIDKIIFRDDMSPTLSRLGSNKTYYNERNKNILKQLKSIAKDTGSIILSPSKALCNNLNCFAIQEGQALYFDDNHISMSGAKSVIFENQKMMGIQTSTVD